MQAKHEDLAMMLKLQTTDIDIIRAKKELADLPQIAKMNELTAKRDALNAKRAQVDAMQKRVEADIARLSTEDEVLADKQRHAQELIDNAGADYRSVESHSKEMSGFAKRREELDKKLGSLAEEVSKIEAIQTQFDKALAVVAADEQKTKASYDEQSASLRANLEEMSQVREAQAAALPANLLKLYQETARHTGGVAVGVLNETKCGVCRSNIDGGRLIELKSEAPLGVCPNCKRLLVIV